MEEANRICKDLSVKYYACMNETRKAVLEGNLQNGCDESFENYSFCIKEVMRRKAEKIKQGKA